jgi:hypothetical protein
VNTFTTGLQLTPAVAVDDNGDFVVVWSSPNDGAYGGIAGQRFDSNGGMLGPEIVVNTYTSGAQRSPSVAVDANGNFVVVWQS